MREIIAIRFPYKIHTPVPGVRGPQDGHQGTTTSMNPLFSSLWCKLVQFGQLYFFGVGRNLDNYKSLSQLMYELKLGLKIKQGVI